MVKTRNGDAGVIDVMVARLADDVTREELAEYFGRNCDVQSARIAKKHVRDCPKRACDCPSAGFGFVTIALRGADDDAWKAYHDRSWRGSRLDVKMSNQQPGQRRRSKPEVCATDVARDFVDDSGDFFRAHCPGRNEVLRKRLEAFLLRRFPEWTTRTETGRV